MRHSVYKYEEWKHYLVNDDFHFYLHAVYENENIGKSAVPLNSQLAENGAR